MSAGPLSEGEENPPGHPRARAGFLDTLADTELLAAHCAGDPDAFGQLARRHSRELWAIALRTLGDPDDAADAVQEALVSAYRRAATFRGDAAVRTWLRRIVVNACIDRIRHERVRPTEPWPERDLPSRRPEPAVEVATRMAVGEALAMVPVEQRLAVVLVDVQGYPVAEAAAIPGGAGGNGEESVCTGAGTAGGAARVPEGGEPMNERTSDSDDPDDPAALAESDADLPDGAGAAVRRRAARSDPRVAEVLDALAATRAELAALPEPEVPSAVAMRWEAALAAEGDRSRPAGDAAAEPPTPLRRRLRSRVVLALSAAAAVVAAVVLGAPRPAPPVLTVSRVDLVTVATSAVGVVDVGDLGDPARREACLRAVLPDAARERLLGGRRVILDGRPGVLLVLATGTRGELHVVTVDPGCGPAGGTLLAQVTVV